MRAARQLRAPARSGLISGLCAALLACAPAPQVTPTAPPRDAPAAPATQPDQPKRGGTLVYAAFAATNTLHPFAQSRSGVFGVLGPVYETLLTYRFAPGFDYRIDYEVLPHLAESWRQPDDTTYLISLRRGVKWHDGQDFTAEDVAFTYTYAREPGQTFQPDVTSRLEHVSGVEAVDPHTVKITLDRPWPLLLQNLAGLQLYILPKHIRDRGDDYAKVSLGTGPFKLKEFDRTKEAVYVRNDSYWQPGRPYVENVRAIFGLDASAKLAAFVAQKSDLLGVSDKAQFTGAIQARPEAQWKKTVQDLGYALIPKVDRPPFQDARVRRAVHLAVDRQAMVSALTGGDGVIEPPGVPAIKTGWAIPQAELVKLPGYRQPKDQDIAEAKRLLAEGGYATGFRTTVKVSGTSYNRNILEVLAAQVKPAGIDLAIEAMDSAAFTRAQASADYEAVMFTSTDSELNYLRSHVHSRGTQNNRGVNDSRLDQLLDAIVVVKEVVERKRLARQLQEHLLEALYFIPTIDPAGYYMWQPWVHEYTQHPEYWAVYFSQVTANNVWLDVEKMPADRH